MSPIASAIRSRPPVVLAVLPRLIPSTLIGVVKPLSALHREGQIVFDVALESWVGRRRLKRADVIVFSRNTEPRHGAPLEAALASGKPIVYELDDNFFAMPGGAPGTEYHRHPARLAQLERYLRHASLVRVYSETLRTRVAALNPRVFTVDGLIDWNLVPTAPPRRHSTRLRIVYATSRVEDTLAAMFIPDLRRVLDEFHGRVEAWFLGYRPAGLGGRGDVRFVEFIPDYDAFFRGFASTGFDIGLAPLLDDEFHRSKSDNKFREYAASRIAGIYSDVPVYRDRVAHGQTGLLAGAEPNAWFGAMKRLIEDDPLRMQIQNAAWAYARGRYGVTQSKDTWLVHLEEALTRPTRAANPADGVRAPLRVRSRVVTLLRRSVNRLRGSSALSETVRWRVRSALAVAKLRRELARSRRAG